MKSRSMAAIWGWAAGIATMLVLVTGLAAFAQSGGPYVLDWSTIDGGGGASSSGQYALTGTIGQPDAGWMAGGDYELLGGFWPGGPLCIVDFEEFALFADYWLQSGPDLPADLDGSGLVDMDDLEMLVYDWLWYCPYGWSLR